MLCENCRKKEATLLYTEVVGDKIKEHNLCEECAQKKGLSKPKSSLAELLLVMAKGLSSEVKKEEKTLVCTCGLTFSEFREGGKLGCVDCYSTFSEKLKPLLQRIHGSTKHVGKIATGDEKYLKIKREIVKLEQQLSRAVARENFEAAAKIRDQIKEYKTLQPEKKNSRA